MPFSAEQFFELFRSYHQSVGTAPLLLNVIGVLVAGFAIVPTRISSRLVFGGLAALWIWMAVVYHWLFFSRINPAAPMFAVGFLAEGILLGWAMVRAPARFEYSPVRMVVGFLFLLYALLGYPLLGIYLGHQYPEAPTFGLPCPTTIFTIAILTLAPRRHRFLLILPILWSVIGTFGALNLGVPEDFGLTVAGAWAIVLLVSPAQNPLWKAERVLAGKRLVVPSPIGLGSEKRRAHRTGR